MQGIAFVEVVVSPYDPDMQIKIVGDGLRCLSGFHHYVFDSIVRFENVVVATNGNRDPVVLFVFAIAASSGLGFFALRIRQYR